MCNCPELLAKVEIDARDAARPVADFDAYAADNDQSCCHSCKYDPVILEFNPRLLLPPHPGSIFPRSLFAT